MHVLIVGGGAIGSAAAYFLARDFGARVTVCERDPAYRRASSALSASSIRQQFSTPINIRLSQWSFAFLRRAADELAVGNERPDLALTERGYLYLATAAGQATLARNHALQTQCGAAIALLTPAQVAQRFPWLATHDLAAGSLGQSGEGWFDGYGLLQALRRKAIALGARYLAAEVREVAAASAVTVRTATGERITGDALLIAAGAWSAPLARQLGFALPVAARKRDVFVFTAPVSLPDCPLVIDPSGVWFRPEGRGFICGAPPRGEDRDDAPLEDIDHGLFETFIWPRLAARVPAFEALHVSGAWAGYYELNTFDCNGIVGPLPGAPGAYVACGFSGHGIQHAPAVGCAIAERIATGRYRTLDLTPLSAERIVQGTPLIEANVI